MNFARQDVKCLIDTLLAQESLLDRFVSEASNLPIALFGCGNSLRYAFDFLQLNHLTPALLIDNDTRLHGTKINGYTVNSLAGFLDMPEKHAVLIVPQALSIIEEIRRQLAARVVQDDIHSFDFINFTIYNPIQEEKSFKDFARKNVDSLVWLYQRLGDEKSRSTLAGFMSGRITSDYTFYDEICVGDSYFAKELVTLSDHEIFVDCGAFDGDTIRDFIGRAPGYKLIYAFEADASNYQTLDKHIRENDLPNIRIFRNAVWNKQEKIAFDPSSDMLSRVGDAGGVTVDAVRLDDVINTSVTQIKMDIEGAEFEALSGAQETIRKYRPRLTICVYHKYQDLTRIAQFLVQLVPEYKLFLRHHSPYGAELVLYAIAN
jgi:FkbM family methyltransferase